MPLLLHEAMVDLFREAPDLAPTLMREALGLTVPVHRSVVVSEASLPMLVPTDFRADLVIELRDDDGTPTLGIIVEVQLHRDGDKLFSWPVYVSTLRARLRCPVCVLVVTPDESVARWAASPIVLGPGSGSFGPIVLGPAKIPRVTDDTRARTWPELAVLSALAHGNEPGGMDVLIPTFEALDDLDLDRGRMYSLSIDSVLNTAARAALKRWIMDRQRWTEMKLTPLFQDLADMIKAEGLAAGLAQSILTVLAARGVTVDAALRERVLACTDVETLNQWLQKASRAISAADIT